MQSKNIKHTLNKEPIMNKKSIFSKINDMYTKATKVIIGDIPHDGDAPQEKSTNTEKIALKNKLLSLKEKFLTMGTPNEKSMLYTEVVKKEKEKNYVNVSLKQTSVKETSSSTKSPTKVTATVTKKISTNEVSIKKPTSQKKVAKKSEESKGVTASKTQKDTKLTASQKKPVTTKKIISTAKPTISKTKDTKNAPTKITATVTKKISTNEVSIKKPTSQKKVAKKSEESKAVAASKTKKDKKAQASKKKPETTKKAKVAKTIETLNKSKATPKTKSAPRGAQKAAKIALYIKDIKKHYGTVDEEFVAIIVKNLGPSIYKKDAELVSCSNPKELDTVRKSFLMKKLGIDASIGVLNAAIQDVCTELKGVRNKYRATFYYALAKKFKKESALS